MIAGGAFENAAEREDKTIPVPSVAEGKQQTVHSNGEKTPVPSYNVSCLINPTNQTVVNFDDRNVVYSVVFAVTVDSSSVAPIASCYG